MQTIVSSYDLKIGMFVSALDRPWIDTPFLLQGLLIKNEDDIKLLKKYCDFVYVDWGRSPLSPPAELIDNPYIPKTPGKADRGNYFSRFAKKIGGLFNGASHGKKDVAANNERPIFIPKNILLSAYTDVGLAEEEVAPAVNAHKRAGEVLNNLVQDLMSNKQFTIEDIQTVVEDVVGSMVRNPDAMMWVTRLRTQDELLYGHGLQVAVYLVALGRHLGLPKEFLEHLCTTGLLLDIGKIRLPKDMLLKKGHLTPEEFETVKTHVQLGLSILKETSGLHADVLQGIAQHHERENGSGYPAGLSKGEISLFGRMAAIADSFVALTNPRLYADTMPAYEALQTLSNFNAELYQSSMVEQFIQAIGVFPVGSMVELSSGEVAVVISHSKVRRLKPRVLIISDADKRPASQPATLDLLYQPQTAEENQLIIQRGLPSGAFGLDAREYYLS